MSRKKAQPFKIRNVLPYAYHEAGHTVVGHVIGRLIERVSLASRSENGYRGYCGFSPSTAVTGKVEPDDRLEKGV